MLHEKNVSQWSISWSAALVPPQEMVPPAPPRCGFRAMNDVTQRYLISDESPLFSSELKQSNAFALLQEQTAQAHVYAEMYDAEYRNDAQSVQAVSDTLSSANAAEEFVAFLQSPH